MSSLEIVSDDDKYVFLYNFQGIQNNCGADFCWGVSLTHYKKVPVSGGWGNGWALNPLTKKHLCRGLELLWPNIEKVFITQGFTIFTDNVNRSYRGQHQVLSTLVDDDVINPCTTATFVQWLILTKKGAMGRGITSVNARHPNESILTSWSWCPDKSKVLSMEQPFYGEEEMKPNMGVNTERMVAAAAAYNEAEKKLYVKQKAVGIAKAKRAVTGIRTRKQPRRISMPIL